MKRTGKQSAELVEKVIEEIRKNKGLTKELITETCKKYGIKKSHIIKVGYLEYLYTL